MATVIGTNGNDSLLGTSGDDQIYGLNGNDVLQGGAGANNLFGGAGNDILDNINGTNGSFISTLEGGIGADRIRGAFQYIDYASYAGSSAGVTVNLTANTASGGDAQGDVFNGQIDGVIGSAFDDVLTGTAESTRARNSDLFGGAGNDILTLGTHGGTMQGGAGADTLIGSMVNPFYNSAVRYTDSPSGVTVNLTTGTGTGGDAEGDVLQNIEDVIGSAYADLLIGGSKDHSFYGRDGDDVIQSRAGADVLAGDDGEDTADYSQSTARIVANMGSGGTVGDAEGDRYYSIEIVRGTNFNDALVGGAGANVLEGGAGADALDGRDGIDTASYAHSTAGVTVSLTTGVTSGGDAQGDILTSFENLIGSAVADTLAGDAGNNTLEGGAGADTLYGSGGTDTASYAHSAAGVQVDLAAGTATGGDAAGDSLFSIEILIGSAHDDVLAGDLGANTLSGGAGDDVLRGRAGADILDGGDGFDRAFYDSNQAGVIVDLLLGVAVGGDAQDDTLLGIEGITGSGLADRLTGSSADNIFYGMAGNDILSGGAGADALSGGAGADQLDGGSGSDTASYYTGPAGVAVNLAAGTASGGDAAGDTLAGIENLTGSNQGDDILIGDGGANVLQGWGGSDVLTGAGGKDALTGGAGADRFVYLDPADSPTGAGADRITDFSRAQADKIDLSAIDADAGAAGNQAFSFIGTALYSGVAGQLRYAIAGGVTTIAGDVNGDGVSDFHIQLNGAIGLVAGDFVL